VAQAHAGRGDGARGGEEEQSVVGSEAALAVAVPVQVQADG
jgi:hypothetical protein